MTTSKKEFGDLLTFAVKTIALHEPSKSLEMIQDELGIALGKQGGHTAIEYWRTGKVPQTTDLEKLTAQLIPRTRLEKSWFVKFLETADYQSDIETFLTEQFPEFLPNNLAVKELTEKQSEGDQLPTTQYRIKLGPFLAAWVLIALIIFAFANFKPSEVNTLCGESELVLDSPTGERFLPAHGVTSFTKENTPGGILNNRVRAVAGTPKGVLVGYFKDEVGTINGLSYFDRNGAEKVWAACDADGLISDRLVNDIYFDSEGRIWIATDTNSAGQGGGIYYFNDHSEWESFTKEAGTLESNATYQIIEADGKLWVAHGQGVSTFVDGQWQIAYDGVSELFNNQVHAVAFDSLGQIWVGHINDGVSLFQNGQWMHINSDQGQLGGDQVRDILVKPATNLSQESVWIASLDGGITKYEQGSWHTFTVSDGLPSDHISALALDSYGRIWAGTDKGTAYFNGESWILYNGLATWDIDFSPACVDNTCPKDDHVWTGTENNGLTHSRLPYLDDAVKITQVCLHPVEAGARECATLQEQGNFDKVIASFNNSLKPGQQFYFEIEVTPLNGHELREERGDFLSYIGEGKENLFGAFEKISVIGTVITGELFVFNNRSTPFTAPSVESGSSQTLITNWRIWTFTRYAGPEIEIEFTVQAP